MIGYLVAFGLGLVIGWFHARLWAAVRAWWVAKHPPAPPAGGAGNG